MKPRWACAAEDGDEGETCGIKHRSPDTAKRCPVRKVKPGPWKLVKVER